MYRQSRSYAKIAAKGVELRDRYMRPDLQEVLISVGPASGPNVTNAGPGQSLHNYGYAFDGCPMRGGKPVWGTQGEEAALWKLYGECADAAGLEWAGHWTKFKEYPHCQMPGVSWQELIITGVDGPGHSDADVD